MQRPPDSCSSSLPWTQASLTEDPSECESRPAMLRLGCSKLAFAAWLLFTCAWLSLGCRPPQAGLGDGPPKVGADTPVLAVFDAAALAGPAVTGLDPGAALAGPPQPPEPAQLPAPAVVDHGPTAEASAYPTLQIRFNRPMVAFGEKRRVSAAEAGFQIEPPIAGEAYWAEPTRLVFEPSKALPLATEYRVSFVRTIAAVDGPELDVDLHWSFGTQIPTVDLWTDSEATMWGSERDEYHWKAKIAVGTTHPISPRRLRKHLRVQARDQAGALRPVEFKVTEQKRDEYGYRYPDFWISPKTRWPADSEVIVTLDEKLRGEFGPRPIGHPTVHSFRTAAGVEALGRSCIDGEYLDGCELGPVAINFSAPITRAQARRVSISPKPRGFDTLAVNRLHDEDDRPRNAYEGVMLWGDFRLGQPYTITLDSLVDVHGQKLVGERSFEVEFIEPPPSLELDRHFGTFTSTSATTIGIESRYLEALKVRVALLDGETHEALLGKGLDKLVWPSGVKPAQEQRIPLSHTGKFGWSSHELDLAQFTGGKPATVLVEVHADALLAHAQGRPKPPPRRGLVQITNLGITAVGSLAGGTVRVARLSDDTPIAGAELELIHAGARRVIGKTDKHGLLKLPGSTELGERALLRARKGDDAVVLPIDRLWQGPAPEGSPLRLGESVRAELMSERPLYKPGERVRVMGWSSIATPHELSGLRRLPSKTKVEIELRDPRDEVVASTTVRAKDHGKFWATLQVPESAALGRYTLSARLLGASFSTDLQVKDFPVPAFEVTAEAERSDIHGGESTTIKVSASYYFGGRVPISRLRYTDDCREVDYRPPGLDPSFSVAPRRKRWGHGRIGRPMIAPALGPSAATGQVEYDISLAIGADGQTQQCTHSVAVGDVSQQEIGAESTIWVHPSFYLAAKSPRVLEAGEDAEILLRTLDFDGQPLSVDEVQVTLKRRWSEPEFVTEGGKQRFAGWLGREERLTPCKQKSSGATSCSFAKLEHGTYEIQIEAKQGDYNPVIRDWLWVSSPHRHAWPKTPAPALSVELDQPTPLSGQQVRAQIRAPWSSGSGMLLLAKGGLHELHVFTLEQGQAEVPLEVSDAWIPGVTLHVLAVEPGVPGAATPKLKAANTKVGLAQDSRQLAVSVQVQAEAQTRESVPIEIQVRDHLGQPVSGHVSVWAVDEAVLSLAPLVLPDFVSTFVVAFNGMLDVVNGYASLLLPFVARLDPYEPRVFDPRWTSSDISLWGVGYGRGFGAGGSGSGYGLGSRGGGSSSMPTTRSKFESAPIFIADAELDEHGVARVSGELPDNLTTFRITAVASAPLASGGVEARFGSSDARVRVTRPVVVRAAMPRIMRPGDLAEVGVIVDNLRGGAGTIDVSLVVREGEGIVELLDKPRAEASIEAGGQLRVPFRIRALTTGTPELEVSAKLRPRGASGEHERVGGQLLGDSLRLPLPVEPERTLTDRVAVYGDLADDGAALLPFVIPSDADPKFGGLSVSVGSTLLGGVEDAVAYLVKYPYGCLEQTSSSLLPLIPLGRLARDYPLGIDDVDGYVEAGVARLRAMQLPGGGFAYWPGGNRPAPYASAYATWVLHQAKAAGYRVPPAMLEAANRYLLGELAAWQAVTGPSLGQDVEAALMLATLAEQQMVPSGAIEHLYERRQRLPVFSQAMLLLALERGAQGGRNNPRQDPRVAALLGELRSVIDEREAVAKVELTQRYTWYWDSSVRSSALVLMAMLRTDPEHPLVPKLTRGLLEARRGGRWSNTQENAYALLALADYAAVYEAEEPLFEGRVWLGNTALARLSVDGRKFGFEDAFTPMTELLVAADQANEQLILERAGKGRMYYRVGLEWASTATDKPAKAEGIELTRTLRSAEGPVGKDQVVDSGALLAIDVELQVPAALDHVAIEVPLPAGLEAVDLELGKGGAAMKLSGRRAGWVSHQELRRDRALLFADHLQPGVHTTTVFLRATTPGEYVMPAGHAQMMYYPEIYGRTTARRLVVR
ncbi:MAG: MG2 domain-containing protein [Enhygromyxa sp.]